MNPKALLSVARETWTEFQQDGGSRLAASLAYSIVFSIAPLLVVVTAIAGALFDEAEVRRHIFEQVGRLVGRDGAAAMHDMMARARVSEGGTLATVLGVLAMLLGATGVFVQLREAMNIAWGVRKKKVPFVRGLLRQRLFSLGMVIAAGLLLLVSLVVQTAIAALTRLLSDRLPGSDFLWQAGGAVLSTGAAAVVFALLFKVLPDARIPWRAVVPGALATALLFTVGQVLLGLYLGRGAFASAYGAAGSFVIVLVWIYYSSQVLLLGAELTQVLARRRGIEITPTTAAEWTEGSAA
jgi:membrane protein